MAPNSPWIYGIAVVVLALGLVLASLLASFQPGTAERALVASGSAEAKAIPDEAVMLLGVETISMSASESQQQNAAIMGAVMAALKSVDAQKDIKASSFTVFPEYEYDYTKGSRKFLGYKTINTIELSTEDIDKAGDFVSAASDSGANRFDSLQFRLSDERMQEVGNKVLADATSHAKAKAEAMAAAAGVKLGKLKSVSESSPIIMPVFRDAKAVMEASAPVPIEPGEVHVTASVTLIYEI